MASYFHDSTAIMICSTQKYMLRMCTIGMYHFDKVIFVAFIIGIDSSYPFLVKPSNIHFSAQLYFITLVFYFNDHIERSCQNNNEDFQNFVTRVDKFVYVLCNEVTRSNLHNIVANYQILMNWLLLSFCVCPCKAINLQFLLC